MKYAILFLLATFAANAQTDVALERLPKPAQTTLAQFTGTTIDKIVTDGGQPTGYIATLQNGTTFIFDNSGSWTEASNPNGLSLDFLPEPVRTSFVKHYGTRTVRSVAHRGNRFSFDAEKGLRVEITATGEDQTPQ